MTQNIGDIFENLPSESQATLMEFAEFLLAKAPPKDVKILQRVSIERPAEETVIAGIKRLNASYPMIERSLMLNDTSALMMQHMMSGKSATDVIDELEVLFENKYKELSEPESSE